MGVHWRHAALAVAGSVFRRASGAKNAEPERMTGSNWARVIFRTDGVAASHALVRFDGADGATLVALQNPEEINEGGRLVVPQGERPGLWLRLDGED